MKSLAMKKPSGDKSQSVTDVAVVVLVLLSVLVLAFGDLMGIIPFFAPVVASPVFPFFHEIHDVLAVLLALYTAYRYSSRLGAAAILFFFFLHIPYAIMRFPAETSDMLRIFTTGLVSLIGIWLIDRLYKTERLYNTLVNSSPIGIYIVQDGKFVFANPQFVNDTGYSQEELLGNQTSLHVHAEDRELAWQNAVAMLKGNRSVPYEYRAVKKTGEIDWILEKVVSINYRGKRASLGYLMNITERKLAEESLRASEENFRNSLESQALGCRIYDGHGNVLYANPALARLYGYDGVAELKVLTKQQTLTPQSREESQVRLQKAHGGSGFPKQYEIDIVRKDGEVRHLEAFTNLVYWGGKKRTQIVYQDITERKKAEERLRKAAQEWRTTFDSITEPISIHDRDFNLVRVNRAFASLVNLKPEETIGKKCYQLMHGTNVPIASCPFSRTMANRRPSETELFEPHLGRFLCMSTSPVLDEHREVVGCVHVARDVTQRKKMEEQLIITDRLASIGQLASGIAHELNNPLTGVIGFSELLLEKDVPDEIRADLTVINKEAKRTAGIVKGLLTFARNQRNEKEKTDILRLIQEVLQLRSYEQRVNNIEVKTHFRADLPQITGNGPQLQQVFINLIVNAEQAMLEAHGKGTMIITAEQAGSNVKISFTDDGPGIAPENMRRLFTPFFTTKEVGKGTGLGLSICHGIVAEHGGRIYAESQKGKGSTFIVELPVAGHSNEVKS